MSGDQPQARGTNPQLGSCAGIAFAGTARGTGQRASAPIQPGSLAVQSVFEKKSTAIAIKRSLSSP